VPRVTGKCVSMTLGCSIWQCDAVCGRLESPATPEHTDTLARRNVGLSHWTIRYKRKEREREFIWYRHHEGERGITTDKNLDPGGLARR